jgi:hypothetical protein
MEDYNYNFGRIIPLLQSLVVREGSNPSPITNLNTNPNSSPITNLNTNPNSSPITNLNTNPNSSPNSVSFEYVSYVPTTSDINLASILLSLFDLSGSRVQNAGLTAVDISNNTTCYKYDDENDDEPLTCPITLEQITTNTDVMKINVCGHIFKEAPLRNWLRGHNRCPVCRRNVSE